MGGTRLSTGIKEYRVSVRGGDIWPNCRSHHERKKDTRAGSSVVTGACGELYALLPNGQRRLCVQSENNLQREI